MKKNFYNTCNENDGFGVDVADGDLFRLASRYEKNVFKNLRLRINKGKKIKKTFSVMLVGVKRFAIHVGDVKRKVNRRIQIT